MHLTARPQAQPVYEHNLKTLFVARVYLCKLMFYLGKSFGWTVLEFGVIYQVCLFFLLLTKIYLNIYMLHIGDTKHLVII